MTTVTLIYPKWHKIPEQTEFHLPPHGPVNVAACIPEQYEVKFIDENVARGCIPVCLDLISNF